MLNEQYHRIGTGGKKYWGKKGAGILFTDGDKVLLLRRKGGGAADHAGKWGIPGGKTEGNESPIETAKRECKEEIGGYEGTRVAQFDEVDGHHKFTVFVFKIDKPFDVSISEEHDKSEWIPIAELRSYPLHPEFEKHLPYYLKAIRQKISHSFAEWLIIRNAS